MPASAIAAEAHIAWHIAPIKAASCLVLARVREAGGASAGGLALLLTVSGLAGVALVSWLIGVKNWSPLPSFATTEG